MQVRDLEERASVSSEKEVSMLERLNQLQSDFEAMRSEKRRFESTASSLNTQLQSVQKEKAELASEFQDLRTRAEQASRATALQEEVDGLRSQLSQAEDELDDMRAREQKQRINLLDELNRLQEEASGLRMQLRQEQRRRPK
jgi:chromosome segregation ATPase